MLSLILGLALVVQSPTRQAFDGLKAEYEAAEADWYRRYPGIDPARPDAEVDYVGRFRDYPAWFYAPRFLAFGEAHPGDPAGIDALFWVADQVSSVGDRDRDLAPSMARALELLARSRIDDPRVDALCRRISFSGSMPSAEAFLRAASTRASSREVRGRAGLGLARLLDSRREVIRRPWFDRGVKSRLEQVIVDRLDPGYVRSVREADPRALRTEVEREFARIASDYGDILADSRPNHVETIAQVVRSELFDITHLDYGQVAPDIEGLDAEGRRFKLSDYRGKVVVLTFSGNWCGPCVAMYPAERALVQRYQGQPFAILSVNTDPDQQALRKSIESGEITWRCWWDGGKDGAITASWNVRSWPTVYVLDAQGKIREKDLRGEQLDDAVAKLVAGTVAKP